MKVYLVRHGIAVSSEIDPDQPLSPDGIKKLEHFGKILKKSDLKIEEIWHSSKLRARQTAEILGRFLSPNIPLEVRAGLKPNDTPELVMMDLNTLDHNLMIVGHLPSLEALLSALLKTERPIFNFEAGSSVCVEKIGGSWMISWAIYPDFFH